MPVGVKQNKKKRRPVGLPGSFSTNELASAFDPGALDAVYGNYNEDMHPDGMGLELPPDVRIAAALAQIPQGLDALPATAPNVPRIPTNQRQFGMPIRGDTQLGQEMTAGIDAMAGIGSRVPFNAGVRMNPGVQSVARNPGNPQLGRYAAPSMETPRFAQVDPLLEAIARHKAADLTQDASTNGIFEINMPTEPLSNPDGTTDQAAAIRRAIAMRANPDYQRYLAAAQANQNFDFALPPMQATMPSGGGMSAKEFRGRVGAQATKNQAARAADPRRMAVTERAKGNADARTARMGRIGVPTGDIDGKKLMDLGLKTGDQKLFAAGAAMVEADKDRANRLAVAGVGVENLPTKPDPFDQADYNRISEGIANGTIPRDKGEKQLADIRARRGLGLPNGPAASGPVPPNIVVPPARTPAQEAKTVDPDQVGTAIDGLGAGDPATPQEFLAKFPKKAMAENPDAFAPYATDILKRFDPGEMLKAMLAGMPWGFGALPNNIMPEEAETNAALGIFGFPQTASRKYRSAGMGKPSVSTPSYSPGSFPSYFPMGR